MASDWTGGSSLFLFDQAFHQKAIEKYFLLIPAVKRL